MLTVIGNRGMAIERSEFESWHFLFYFGIKYNLMNRGLHDTETDKALEIKALS